jgi:hypothetical protein
MEGFWDLLVDLRFTIHDLRAFGRIGSRRGEGEGSRVRDRVTASGFKSPIFSDFPPDSSLVITAPRRRSVLRNFDVAPNLDLLTNPPASSQILPPGDNFPAAQ